MKKIIFYVCISLFLFSSCEKIIDFDGEIKEPKLVLNGMMINNEILTIHLSHSLSVIDQSEIQNVTNASVLIFQNGSFLDSLHHISDGYYKSTVSIQAGNSYSIKATAPNFKEIEATDIVPTEVIIDSISSWVVASEYEDKLHFKIHINDNANEENYYIIRVYSESWLEWQEAWIYCMDPYIDNEIGADESHPEIYLPDHMFNGKTYSLEISTYKWNENPEDFKIQIFSCSKAFYQYAKSIQKYNWNDGDPFSQPVQVYSNISNGYGIFAGGSIYEHIETIP